METKDFLADDELDSEEEEQLHQSFNEDLLSPARSSSNQSIDNLPTDMDHSDVEANESDASATQPEDDSIDISDEGVPLASGSDSSITSDSDPDYASVRDRDREPEEVDGPTELKGFLAGYFCNFGVSREQGNYLVKGLKNLKHQDHHFDSLDSDLRTYLNTSRQVTLETLAGGSYFHFGLEKGIV